jgi:hypothetical protein
MSPAESSSKSRTVFGMALTAAMPITSAMPVLTGAMFHQILEQHWQYQ